MPEGIVTLVPEFGTPPHQLDAVNQSVLVVPSHEPGAVTVSATLVDVRLQRPELLTTQS